MKDKLKNISVLQGLVAMYRTFFKGYRRRLGNCTSTSHIASPRYIVGHENVYMGENTGIAANATILCSNAKFTIKNNSGCAPGLFVATGNHERRIGRFYRSITEVEKAEGLDRDVTIEEDCWIGGNVAILSGVTIRRGTTVANGAVVSKDTPPYSVCGGVPARFIKFYWTIDEILEHEESLYSESERYTREELVKFFEKYQK